MNRVSSSGEILEVDVRDIRYWKPWQPPLSTFTRRQREGLESFVIIWFKRFEARGVISMVMSWPVSSSVRGFRIVFVVDMVGPLGGGGFEEGEIVSIEGGLERGLVVDNFLLAESWKDVGLEERFRCLSLEAMEVDGV